MYLKKNKVFLASLLAIFLLVGGCNKIDSKEKIEDTTQISTEENDSSTLELVDTSELEKVIVTVGDSNISYSEVMIYVQYIKNKYEAMFGKEIWDYSFGGQTFEDMAKEEIMNMITQTMVVIQSFDGNSSSYAIELTEEEEHNIGVSADKFLEKLSEEEIARHGFTQELVKKFYRDNKLFERIYDAESMNVDTEVSNEEAKKVNINYIFLATTKKNDSNETVSMTEDEKAVVYEKMVQIREEAVALVDTLIDEDGFIPFASKHSSLEEVVAIYGEKDSSYLFASEGLTLNSKELSEIIEKEDGYYLLYSVNDFDKVATLEEKERIIAQRQNEAFKSTYKKWASKVEIKVKDTVWKEVRLSQLEQSVDDNQS